MRPEMRLLVTWIGGVQPQGQNGSSGPAKRWRVLSMHHPKPFFRTGRGWYVRIGKNQIKLADGPKNSETESAAWAQYHKVMAAPRADALKTSPNLGEPTLLSFFCHHVVALCGQYAHVDAQGKQTKPPSYYCYSATVILLGEDWYIATAGHCIECLEDAEKHPEVRLSQQTVIDYNGFAATTRIPLLFKPLEQPNIHIHDDDFGVDFGLIHVRHFYREGLKQNKIIPFGPEQWMISDRAFDGHCVIGFPKEYVETILSGGKVTGGRIKPTMIHLKEIPDDSGRSFPRFKATILDKGTQKSIEGMSGGPILGYYQDGNDVRYRLIAIQSKVTKDESAVYGCPVGQFLKLNSSPAERQ
jgi:hypothetical protein